MTEYNLIKFYLEYSKNLSRVRDIAVELLDGNSVEQTFLSWGEIIINFYNRNKNNYEG